MSSKNWLRQKPSNLIGAFNEISEMLKKQTITKLSLLKTHQERDKWRKPRNFERNTAISLRLVLYFNLWSNGYI